MTKKLHGLTIFFPFFNDEGTVLRAIELAFKIGYKLTDDLEVIAIHGGNSHDFTWKQILLAKKIYPDLKIIDQKNNTIGYAVIKFGLKSATKEWVFYTDGDLQYDVRQLFSLVKKQREENADLVNGYKLNREDFIHRILLGNAYQFVTRYLFRLPIRDIDCDFRLLRTSVLKNISFESKNAAILTELIIKLSQIPIVFAEVPVAHSKRTYGKSNYCWWKLSWEKIYGDFVLYLKFKKIRQNLGKNQF